MEITEEEYNRLCALDKELKELREKQAEEQKKNVSESVNEPLKPLTDLFDDYCKKHYDKRS